jgi:uncharacterized protein involved in exopolysaccharide biosynthesis
MDQQPHEPNPALNETIQRVLRIVKKARWLMAATGILTVVGANIVLDRFIASKYVSEATILVVDPQISASIVAPVSSSSLMDGVQVAAREALSQSRLLAIVDEFGLVTPGMSPDDAVQTLRSKIEIESSPQYPAFSIAFTAKTPQLAHDVTQKLTDLYLERQSALQSGQLKTAQNLIDGKLAERRQRLSQMEESIAAYSGQHPDDLADERASNLQQLRDARSRLDSVLANEDSAKRQRATMQSTLRGRLNARITVLEEQRADLLKNFTDKYPAVLAKDREIAQARAEMQGIQNAGETLLARDGSAAADPVAVQLEAQLDANRSEIESLSRDADRQTALIADYQRRLSANPIHAQKLSEMTRQADELKGEISDLTAKQQTSDLSASMAKLEEGKVFRLIDPASLPTHPSSKKKQEASLAAAAAGPLLGLLLTFLLDLRKPKFFTESDLRRTFAPPLVVAIPLLRTKKERRIRAVRIGFEVLAGCIVFVLIAGTEAYAYRLLTQV